jgi:hypothetical protein
MGCFKWEASNSWKSGQRAHKEMSSPRLVTYITDVTQSPSRGGKAVTFPD